MNSWNIVLFLIGIFCVAEISTKSLNKTNKFGSQLITAKNVERLDEDGKVILGWEVNEETGVITFEIEAETLGFIGFGISPQGSMTGADIFIAGVLDDGTRYFSDRYGTGFEMPKVDVHQDWTLIDAVELESMGRTFIKFSRLIDTCDPEDYPIGTDTTRVIWALGSTDTLEYHLEKGVHSINLLGTPMPEIDLDGTTPWVMTLDMEMPAVDTSYWCSFHKAPLLDKKHQIVAFDAYLDGADAIKHTHHFILYNCYLPPNHNQTLDEVFGDLTVDKGFLGNQCFDPEVKPPLPTEFCNEYLFVWAKGGKLMTFPENVGYPIGEEGGQKYHMLEIHYDNPNKTEGLKFNTGVQFYYTDNLRDKDAGLLGVGHNTELSITIPGNTQDFAITGHCHSDCTDHFFPTDGINIFNVLLHAHISGRKLKLRHFRGNQELPWIDYDDHYDFDYQQNKPIPLTKVLPGDQLTYECHYDSTWNNGKVVVGGISTYNEMCTTFLWYYPKNDLDDCESMYPFWEHMGEFGILEENTHYDFSAIGRTTYIDAPEYLKGPYPESINNFTWTKEFIETYQQKRKYGVHEAYCISRKTLDYLVANASYPEGLVEYVPNDFCNPDAATTGTTTTQTPQQTTQSSASQIFNNIHIYFTVLITSIFYWFNK